LSTTGFTYTYNGVVVEISVYRDGLLTAYLRMRYQLEKAGARLSGHPVDIVDVIHSDTEVLERYLLDVRELTLRPPY